MGSIATIRITPETDTVPASSTQRFSTVVRDAAGREIAITPTWSIDFIDGGRGAIDSTGLFRADSLPGTCVIRAAVGSISDSAVVTTSARVTTPGPLMTIAVRPDSVSVLARHTQQFTAAGKDSAGNMVAITPIWSVRSGGGAISTSGLLTAGDSAGTSIIRATSGSVFGTAVLAVTAPGSLSRISIAPNPATIPEGQPQQFTATGTDSAGHIVTFTPMWAVDSGVGEIGPSGVLSTYGLGRILLSARSEGVVGTAVVTTIVGPLARIYLSPSPANVLPSATQQFIVEGTDLLGFPLAITPEWSVPSGKGSVTNTGTYTAGATIGEASVQARVGTVSGYARVVIMASGIPAKVVFATQPSTTPAGSIVTPPVQVAVEDAGGSVATSFSGSVNVYDAHPDGHYGPISYTRPVFAVNGIATFYDLSVGRPGGLSYQLAADAQFPTGNPSARSTFFDVPGATPSRLAFTVGPAAGIGSPCGWINPVDVQVQDSAGAPVVTYTGVITLSIGANPGGGILSGAVSGGAVNAPWAGFDIGSARLWPQIDQPGNGYTLVASAPGLASGVSTPFDMPAPPACRGP